MRKNPTGRPGGAGHVGGFCVPHTIQLTPDKGRGAFAETTMAEGTVVWRHVPGQYEVHDEPSFERLLSPMSREDVVYELDHVVILPELPEYVIRYLDDGALINHSGTPNLATNRPAGPPRVLRVASTREAEELLLGDAFAIVATRAVEAGEELTMDYESEDGGALPYYDALCERYGLSWPWLS